MAQREVHAREWEKHSSLPKSSPLAPGRFRVRTLHRAIGFNVLPIELNCKTLSGKSSDDAIRYLLLLGTSPPMCHCLRTPPSSPLACRRSALGAYSRQMQTPAKMGSYFKGRSRLKRSRPGPHRLPPPPAPSSCPVYPPPRRKWPPEFGVDLVESTVLVSCGRTPILPRSRERTAALLEMSCAEEFPATGGYVALGIQSRSTPRTTLTQGGMMHVKPL